MQGPALLAYFFFDFNNSAKQSEENLLRSLLVQLASVFENGLEILDALFLTCSKGTSEPSRQTLLKTLYQLISSIGEVFIIVDALDERPSREGLLRSIKQIMDYFLMQVQKSISGMRNLERLCKSLLITRRQ